MSASFWSNEVKQKIVQLAREGCVLSEIYNAIFTEKEKLTREHAYRMFRRILNEADIDAADMLGKGFTLREVGARLGCHRDTAVGWLLKAGYSVDRKDRRKAPDPKPETPKIERHGHRLIHIAKGRY